MADTNAVLDRELQSVAVRVFTAYLEGLLAQDQLALVLAQKQAYNTQLEAARRREEGRGRGGGGPETGLRRRVKGAGVRTGGEGGGSVRMDRPRRAKQPGVEIAACAT